MENVDAQLEPPKKVSQTVSIVAIIIIIAFSVIVIPIFAVRIIAGKMQKDSPKDQVVKIADIKSIRYASQSYVDSIFGRPDVCQKSSDKTRNVYKSGTIEIIFEHDSVKTAIFHHLKDCDIDKTFLKHLCLPYKKPKIVNDNYLAWEDIESIKSIILFPPAFGGYVKVHFDKPKTLLK